MAKRKTWQELRYDPSDLRHNAVIGTGGIGTGMFFRLNGDHTLGREESRSGHFLDIRDYCKQHIILHYVKVLLGRHVQVIPAGKVGDDAAGKRLILEMAETGMKTGYIEKVPGADTLFSFCFSYPDNTGGNLTTDNSASARVDIPAIMKVEEEVKSCGPRGIIMAAPEVPLSARYALLKLGKMHGLFCTASFTSEEIREAADSGALEVTDLVSVNADEAAALAGVSAHDMPHADLVQAALRELRKYNPDIRASVTTGKQGSYCWDGHTLNAWPAVRAEAVSTAGAGDAFFSGLLCGIALGLHLFEAQQLATLLAGMSVTSAHTIHKGIDRRTLGDFRKKTQLDYSEKITKLLED